MPGFPMYAAISFAPMNYPPEPLKVLAPHVPHDKKLFLREGYDQPSVAGSTILISFSSS